MREKSTVLTIVSYRYSILVSLSIFAILLHAIVLQSYHFINNWLPLIKDAVQIQEERGINLQIELNADEISAAFDETTLFFEVLVSYSELIFQGRLPSDNFYDSFHEGEENVFSNNEFGERKLLNTDLSFQQVADNSTRALSFEISENFAYSIWYHNNESVYHDPFTSYELNSTHLDNIFRATYLRYPSITAMYVGMENGLLRVYPQERLETNFPIRNNQNDECDVMSLDATRYEHRCDEWYRRAFLNPNGVIYGSLHVVVDRDDSKDKDGGGGGGNGGGGGGGGGGGFVESANHEEDNAQDNSVDVLTLSKTLFDAAGNIIGVLAMDIKNANVVDLLQLPLLQSGYQFVIVSDSKASDLDYSVPPDSRLVAYHNDCRKMFCSLEELEPELFSHVNIVESIYNGSTGNSSFYSDDIKYFVSYTAINLQAGNYVESLSLVGIVPYDEIDRDYLILKDRMQRFATYSFICCVCIVVVVFIILTLMSKFFFKTLVNPLHEFNSQASEFNDRGLEEELGNVYSTSSSAKYMKMAQVTSSFQSLVYILEDINRSYVGSKFEVAYEQILLLEHIFHEMENEPGLGVILNNKGNILLKLFEVEDHEKLAHDCFKEAIRIGHRVMEDFSKIDDEKKKTQAMYRYHTLALAGRYCNMGNYYQLVRDFKAAINVYEMSIGLYTQAGDTLGKARARGNIGHIYLALFSRKKAKDVFEDTFQIAVDKFSKRPTAKARELLQNASMNMGIFYRLDARYEKARPYFVYALELSKDISRAVLFRCYSELVFIYHHSVDPRAQAMVNLLKKDKSYYTAVTPRSIYFVVDKSASMKKLYNNKNTNSSINNRRESFSVSCESMRSVLSQVEVMHDEEYENITRIGYAKDCVKFVINSCLSGNDYISLTTFNQQINRIFDHKSLQDNKEFVLSQLENIINEDNCSGPCAFYDALQNTLLAAYGNTSFSNFDSWIVVLTTGKDNASTRTMTEMEAIMARINVNFIVISLDTGNVDIKKNQMNSSSLMSLSVINHLEEEKEEDTIDGNGAKVEEDPLAKRKEQYRRKRRSTFATSGLFKSESDKAHPLDCLFETTSKRKCFHLNSAVTSNDRILYELFSAFEEIEINVFETFMEAVI